MPSYPTLTGGIRVHRPWGYTRKFRTSIVDMDSGYRYSFFHLPSPLMEFHLVYPMASDADLATIKTFYSDRHGPFEEFDFTNPETAIVHARCRFGDPGIRAERVGPNENQVTVNLIEYAA